MKKYIILGLSVIIVIFSCLVGYRFYCESVINSISEDFISIFSEGVNEEPNEKDTFYELKKELYDRKSITIELLDKEIDEELSKIEYNPVGVEEYLLWDTRSRTTEIAEILNNNGYYYSNGNVVLLNDIVFSDSGYCGVVYNKTLLHLYQTDYPISYKKVIESSDYDFYFSHYEKTKGGYDLFFVNNNDETIKIKLYFSFIFNAYVDIYGLKI